MFFNLETAKSSKRKEQVVGSSRLIGVGYSCLFPFMVTWRYQRLDKHRMVPPFIIIIIMKKFFILMCLVAVSNISSAQSKLKEADFIGNVRILNADSTTVNLERINVQLKTKATGSKIW